ncbi:MAG: hypothetical protein SOR93_06480 [Clostridiales Family XIII bacterium]|nr:hypothetical protein [Clostridia bacterium]MDY3010900.1 hypothetical protein [Clostridiales Family XIII bacterium]
MNSSKTIARAKIVERLMANDILPEEYDLTIGQANDIRAACGSDVYEVIAKAYCFGFYQATMLCLTSEAIENEKNL